MTDYSTICAISTSPGMGPVAMIRLSGKKAIEIADLFFHFKTKNKKLADQPANTIHVGIFSEGSEIIDQVVVLLFHAPHSFTGEDIVEINCHGSVYIQQRILQVLISGGARMALPGEFSKRAFLNGKMDLSQAEAVADLISSSTKASQQVAMHQMRGGFSSEISDLRKQLVEFISLIELELDFSDEDIEFADRKELTDLINHIYKVLLRLKNSYQLGNVIKNGIPSIIIGETNVGKSTLLNVLVNENRAMVSNIHGTTRDVIEDVVNIQGTAFRFFDTAGLRKTTDQIENMGIERTYETLKKATIVILIVDTTNSFPIIEERIQKIRKKLQPGQHLIITANKVDIGKEETIKELKDFPLQTGEKKIFISAKSHLHTDELVQLMINTVDLEKASGEDTIITNARHYEAVSHAADSIQRVKEGMIQKISGEFLSQDIRECINYLGEITGDITSEDILGSIFKHFCIGK